MTPTLLQANRIARDNLSACFTSVGFVAGAHHFVDLWARDSLFATFGANAIGQTSASKQTIKTFLAHQRADGLIPFLILRSRHNAGKYFGRHTYLETPKPQFRSHQSGGLVPDGGLMTIIAARAYAEVTNDDIFLKQQYPKLRAALGVVHHKIWQWAYPRVVPVRMGGCRVKGGQDAIHQCFVL